MTKHTDTSRSTDSGVSGNAQTGAREIRESLRQLVDMSWTGLKCRYCWQGNVGDGSPERHLEGCPIPSAKAALNG